MYALFQSCGISPVANDLLNRHVSNGAVTFAVSYMPYIPVCTGMYKNIKCT